MNGIGIHLSGDGAFPQLQGATVHHVKDVVIDIALLRGGMASGRHSVSMVIPMPDGSYVLLETTAALFIGAARAFHQRITDDASAGMN